MTKCPVCGKKLKSEKREIFQGIYAQVEVCLKCNDEWIDESEYSKLQSLFRRKVFKVGGSLAVRIPKEIADIINLEEGEDLSIKTRGDQIIIEKILR